MSSNREITGLYAEVRRSVHEVRYMSEQEIHSNDLPPSGDIILAYGTSPRASRARMFLFVAAGIFLLCLGSALAMLQTTVPLPERRIALASVRPRTALPNGVPDVWKDTIQRSPFPVLIGLTVGEQGMEPFAIIVRGFASPRFAQEHAGIFSLVSERPLPKKEFRRLAHIVPLLSKTIVAPAFIRIDARAIDLEYAFDIEGAVRRDGVWKTNIRLKQASEPRITDGDFSLDIRAFPDAWPFVKDAIQRAGFFFDATETPATVAWSETDQSLPRLVFGYIHGPTTSTKRLFAAAAGAYNTQAYKLPDDVVVEELRLPKSVINTTSSNSTSVDGMILKIHENELLLESASSTGSRELIAPCSKGGWPVLKMNKAIIAKISQKINNFSQIAISNLIMSQKNDLLEICIK